MILNPLPGSFLIFMKEPNKVSIILATYRNEPSVLQRSINSVLSQNYNNLELIIVTGDKKFAAQKKTKIIYREPKGISDAFNTGLNNSAGDYVYFLGAGDILWNKDVISKIMAGINNQRDLLVCGRINRLSEDGKNIVYTSGLGFHRWHLLYKMGLPHQGLFTNRKYFVHYGQFDNSLKYAMDYDLLLRAYQHFPQVTLKDIVVAGWRAGGVGANKNADIMKEYFNIRRKNNIAPVWLLWIIYVLSLIRYG